MATARTTPVPTEDDDDLRLDEDALEPFDPTWNLQERHAVIMRSLAKVGVPISGQNRFRRPALSIEDVDVLLERLMGRYGVVSDYEVVLDGGWPKLVSLDKSQEEGVYERWEIAVWSVIRDTRAVEERECERRLLYDVGSNPSAAISFALKRHKRELYHLGAIKEGVSDEPTQRGERRTRRDLSGLSCPLCGNVGALGWSQRKGVYYCEAGKGGCGEEFPDLETGGAKPIDSERVGTFQRLLRLGAMVGQVDGHKRQGAPFWPETKLKARIKLLSESRNSFDKLTDAEWAKGTREVEGEMIAEHGRFCGPDCEHL